MGMPELVAAGGSGDRPFSGFARSADVGASLPFTIRFWHTRRHGERARRVYNRTVIPPLQGQLSTYGFSDLLQWMEMNRRSGRLTVMRGKDRKVIDWKDGHIAYVSGSHPKDRLGVFLNRIGAVPST